MSAVKRCKSGTDRLTEFKLGENYPITHVTCSPDTGNRNMTDFRSVRWKRTPEHVVWLPNYCFLL